MAENAAKSGAEGWDDEAVAKAHAIYTPSMLSIYDVLVLGCPTISPGAARHGSCLSSIAPISRPIISRLA